MAGERWARRRSHPVSQGQGRALESMSTLAGLSACVACWPNAVLFRGSSRRKDGVRHWGGCGGGATNTSTWRCVDSNTVQVESGCNRGAAGCYIGNCHTERYLLGSSIYALRVACPRRLSCHWAVPVRSHRVSWSGRCTARKVTDLWADGGRERSLETRCGWYVRRVGGDHRA